MAQNQLSVFEDYTGEIYQSSFTNCPDLKFMGVIFNMDATYNMTAQLSLTFENGSSFPIMGEETIPTEGLLLVGMADLGNYAIL